MATRSHTTYKKRQKELARLEKQREKMARRMQRKLEKNHPADGPEPEDAFESAADALESEAPREDAFESAAPAESQ